MITARGESFILQRYPRKLNSPFEWEEVPDISFFGRPASPQERKNYRIQAGVHGSEESVYILASNLPKEIRVDDKITFNGDEKTVESIGYFLEDSRIINNHIMSHEYIIDRCPKGLTLR